jgi:hypothetical protein
MPSRANKAECLMAPVALGPSILTLMRETVEATEASLEVPWAQQRDRFPKALARLGGAAVLRSIRKRGRNPRQP